MAGTVYVSFNDERDSARANQVRRFLIQRHYTPTGYWPYTAWSRQYVASPRRDFEQRIDGELAGSDAILILIGADTAANTWVRYVIEHGHATGKPMLGVRIHALPDERGRIGEPDINPFERFAIMDGRARVRLSERYAVVDWDAAGNGQLEAWLADAVAGAQAARRADSFAPTASGRIALLGGQFAA